MLSHGSLVVGLQAVHLPTLPWCRKGTWTQAMRCLWRLVLHHRYERGPPPQVMLDRVRQIPDRERHDREVQTMNEAEIRAHFIESAKGDPCHLCGSKPIGSSPVSEAHTLSHPSSRPHGYHLAFTGSGFLGLGKDVAGCGRRFGLDRPRTLTDLGVARFFLTRPPAAATTSMTSRLQSGYPCSRSGVKKSAKPSSATPKSPNIRIVWRYGFNVPRVKCDLILPFFSILFFSLLVTLPYR